MTNAGWRVIRWARTVPTVFRKDGRPDHMAHFVLLVLASYADGNGCARPSMETIADDARLTDRAARQAVATLQSHGLIAPAGDWNGTTVWRMETTRTREGHELDAADRRREAKREKTAARMREYRKRQRDAVEERNGDAVVERHVTPSESVTESTVTPSHDARDAVPGRTLRLATTHVTPSPASHLQVSSGVTANELPLNCHRTASANAVETESASKSKRNSGYTDDFEAFWSAYGRKGSKAGSFKRWRDAVKVAPVEVIMRAVPAYVASTGGDTPKFRKDAENWLSGECWESVVVPAGNRAVNGHQPYRNPTDESVWDESL